MNAGSAVPTHGGLGSLKISRPLFKSLLAVVLFAAGCGVLAWTWQRAMWEFDHPTVGAVRALRDRNPRGRMAAIENLELFGADDEKIAIPPLITRLGDDDENVRAAAAKALGTVVRWSAGRSSYPEMASRAIAALVESLKDPDLAVRVTVVDSLLQLPWATLLAQQDSTDHAVVKSAAAPSLSVEPSNVVSALGDAVADPEPEVRSAAVRALGFIAAEARTCPSIMAGGKRDQAALDAGSEPATPAPRSFDSLIPLLFRVLEQDERPVREACRSALSMIEPPVITAASVPALVAALDRRDREVRYQAIAMIARLGPAARPAADALLTTLTGPEQTAQVGPENLEDPSADPAATAALALGRVVPGSAASAGAIAALAQFARSNRPSRRISAIESLTLFGPESRVVAAVVDALSDRDSSVRLAAIRALAALGPKLATEPPSALCAVLNDESAANRPAAAAALATFQRGLDPFVPALLQAFERTKDQRIRIDFCRPIFLIEPPAITRSALPALMTGLKSQDWGVRHEAAILIGKLGREASDAIPQLVDIAVREATMSGIDEWSPVPETLARLAPGTDFTEKVIVELIRVVRDGTPRRQGEAISALAEFGPAAVAIVPDLIQRVTRLNRRRFSWEWGTAAAALGRIAPGTPAADAALDALLASLLQPPSFSRDWGIRYLHRFGPSEKVIASLQSLLETASDRDLEAAIIAVGGLGPPASGMIPRIRALAHNSRGYIGQAATDALAALEAGERKQP